jgi:hypothetical protein
MEDAVDRIRHLMALYHWSYWEAYEYLSYSEYDISDWYDTQWEEMK